MQTKRKIQTSQTIGISLGRAIAQHRKDLGLTQDDLAGLVEVDAETISRFERGAVLPSLTRLQQIATSLKVGLGELLTESSGLTNDQASRLVSLMSKMTAEKRGLLIGFAELLAQDSGKSH